ncbi:3-methyl-2-oxobutanoate hydroxymethyltransferase [Phytophthora ramorum]|uniref:3-methyl-2-oxobutanoate hydroxymethyltransferase n=1 Tax=Phytophthora ramorum TaxID=164328 RepID=UPI00309B7121|nr:3-methyl-2-oxobutanoate hydroxymethyltransferase [Phytophthora ramorum]
MVTIQTHFLGRSVRYVCQNGTPCRLLAIANVLLLEGVVEGPDSVEGGKERAETTTTIVDGGIAVAGHIGLRSQHTSAVEGFRAQGRTAAQEQYMDSNYYIDAQAKAQTKPQQTSVSAATRSANDYYVTPTPAPTKPIVYMAPTSSDNHRLGAQRLFVTSVLSSFEAAWMLSQP